MQDPTNTKSGSWASAALACAAALAVGTGCEDNVPYPVRLPAEPTTSPDGGAGGGGTTVRQMVERPLFGQMPLDNRFIDPGFGLLDGTGWLAWDWETGAAFRIARVHLARTPGKQPALKLYAPQLQDDGNDGYVLGQIKSIAGPVVVSIWLGRGAEQDPIQDSSAALLGMFLDDTPGAVDLAPDTDPEPVTLDGYRWQRMSAQCADGPVGFASLRVAHNSDIPLLLSSPILVAVDGDQAMGSTHRAERRALTEVERGALQALAEQQRRRFGTVPASAY